MRGLIFLFGLFGIAVFLFWGCSSAPQEISARKYLTQMNQQCLVACNHKGQTVKGLQFIGRETHCLCRDLPTTTVVDEPKVETPAVDTVTNPVLKKK